MDYFRRFTTAIVLGSSWGLCPISAGLAQTPYQPKSITQLLANTDWVSLPLPDNRMTPGAVIKVTPRDKTADVRWLGDIKNCGIPNDALGLVRGKYPPIGIGENFSVDVSIAAGLLSKIGLGAEASKVSGAVLRIEESGGDAIDLLALSVWLSKPGNASTLPEACSKFLAQDGVYLVNEAFRISKGSYDLFDKNGAKLKFEASTPSQGVSGQVGVSQTSAGTLTITEDYYFAVRRAKQLSPTAFVTLGAPASTQDADDLLRRAERIE